MRRTRITKRKARKRTPIRPLPAPSPEDALAGLSLAIAAGRGAEAEPPRSGPPSSAGVAVPSSDDLRKELFAVCRPDQEPLGPFLSRIARLVLALKAHNVAASDLERVKMKATTLSGVYLKIAADWDPKKLVKALKLKFNTATLGDLDGPDELTKETNCIGDIILALGGKESSKPGKALSTPSDEPLHVVPVEGSDPSFPPSSCGRRTQSRLACLREDCCCGDGQDGLIGQVPNRQHAVIRPRRVPSATCRGFWAIQKCGWNRPLNYD